MKVLADCVIIHGNNFRWLIIYYIFFPVVDVMEQESFYMDYTNVVLLPYIMEGTFTS